MRPIGLTIKDTRKKYGPGCGELLLIHVCEECKNLSLNRLAADDDPQMVFTVFEDSLRLDTSTHAGLEACDIHALNVTDSETVCVQLFGHEADLAAMLFKSGTMELV
jgi:hypothetical protein